MRTFDDQLMKIHREISIKKEDRRPYTKMFDTIRKWLIDEMCYVDPVFKKLFKGTELFGSYPNRVRIIKPSEYDIFILLKFPFPFSVYKHPERPGFVEIKSRACESITGTNMKNTCEYLFQRRGKLCPTLNRNRFQRWIKRIIEIVLATGRLPTGYEIKYNPCSVAHTIKAKQINRPFKKISIDFVPAIVLQETNMTSIIKENQFDLNPDYFETFVGIPKPLVGCGPKSSRRYSFQLVNPVAERDIIWDHHYLKVVYRLLKALRNNYKNLHRLKSYFLTAIFLFEVESHPAEFWQQPVGDTFLYMLDLLIQKFERGCLPFYWSPDFNLLSILRPEEIEKYTAILTNAYNRLLKIDLNQEYVTYSVRSHFKTTN